MSRLRDFDVLAWDLTSAVRLPTVACLILDRHEPSDSIRGASMGYGCHLRREVAFQRALTEAAQSRLTLITGSRDDLGGEDYEDRREHREGIAFYRALVSQEPAVAFSSLPTYLESELDGQVTLVLDLLRDVGVEEVAVTSLTRDDDDVSVLRVVVPQLRGPTGGH